MYREPNYITEDFIRIYGWQRRKTYLLFRDVSPETRDERYASNREILKTYAPIYRFIWAFCSEWFPSTNECIPTNEFGSFWFVEFGFLIDTHPISLVHEAWAETRLEHPAYPLVDLPAPKSVLKELNKIFLG